MRAYSISVVEAAKRAATASGVSVPLPDNRLRSSERDGGERKMKSGSRLGWLALISLTPCNIHKRQR